MRQCGKICHGRDEVEILDARGRTVVFLRRGTERLAPQTHKKILHRGAGRFTGSMAAVGNNGHAGFALRDQLRLALRRDSSARAGSEAPTIAGLLPIQGDPLFQSAETDESLTLFQVVHLRYETLAPRLR